MEKVKFTTVHRIDEVTFMMAFGRDVDYQDIPPLQLYLDRQMGYVLWVYESDEDAQREMGTGKDNEANRHLIANNPDRFLLIPGLDHGKHHKILQKFLDSKWTDNEKLHKEAQDVYCCDRSIGRWRRDMGDEVFYAYKDFRDYQIKKMAEKFLRKHGIKPLWK
jgi:hypothetical protein